MRTVLSYLSLAVVVSAITLILLQSGLFDWTSWKPATCVPSGCFCEMAGPSSSIRQKANTWSSLAFIFSSFLILALDRNLRVNRNAMSRANVVLLSMATLLIGLGSAFFHASLSLIGQFFDVFGMYLLASFILSYALSRLCGWQNSTAASLYVGLNIALVLLLLFLPEVRRYLFAFILLAGIVTEVVARRSKKLLISKTWWNTAFLIFSIGYVIWVLDNFRIVCNPSSWLQGHAIWHILGAVSIVLLFMYFAGERKVSRSH